jgi:CRISPR-associated protein Cas2
MAEPRHWHLVMYDVCDDGRLRRVHKLLRGWGKAMQYSVFRVRCSARELERMRFELTQVLGEEDRNCRARESPRAMPRDYSRRAPKSPSSFQVEVLMRICRDCWRPC